MRKALLARPKKVEKSKIKEKMKHNFEFSFTQSVKGVFRAQAALLFLLVACSGIVGKQELVVFAAASLTDAFDQIAAEFEANYPGVDVLNNYANSSQLAMQLVEGAQADVFASANQNQMQVAVDAGFIQSEPVVFVTNRLTIIVPWDNHAGVQSPADLTKPGLRLVLAAPGVPARDYSDQSI